MLLSQAATGWIIRLSRQQRPLEKALNIAVQLLFQKHFITLDRRSRKKDVEPCHLQKHQPEWDRIRSGHLKIAMRGTPRLLCKAPQDYYASNVQEWSGESSWLHGLLWVAKEKLAVKMPNSEVRRDLGGHLWKGLEHLEGPPCIASGIVFYPKMEIIN